MKDKSRLVRAALAARLVFVLGGFLAYDLTRRDPMTSYEDGLFPASLAEGDVELLLHLKHCNPRCHFRHRGGAFCFFHAQACQ